MQYQRECHKDPRQIWRREDQQTQEAEPCLRVPSAPNVHEGAGQCASEEGDAEEGRERQQEGGGIENEPGELRRGATRRFLEKARVTLEEEDMEEEVEGQRAEVEEGCYESPVLLIPNQPLTPVEYAIEGLPDSSRILL